MGNPEFEASIDPRIKVIVAFAPWGMQRGVWNAEGLAGIKIPSLFVAGSLDDISGYENGTKAIYEGAINSERYLLTYLDARHNTAPNPAPAEALDPARSIDEYLRYADSVWDSRRINNVNQHFVTAFLGYYLKGNQDYKAYLHVKENTEKNEWPGFKPRTTVGLEMDHQPAKK
jgi:predicted dienelactone hydrolase